MQKNRSEVCGEVAVRAIVSVYDKTGIVEFARGLNELGIEFYSTGGTQELLRGAGVSVRPVAARNRASETSE